MDDKNIIELYLRRDEQALAATEEKYGKLCHRIARNILKDESDSEECVNDTYFSVWNSIPPARPDSLTAFIAKIARNLSLKRLEYNRAAKRNGEGTASLDELGEFLGDSGFIKEVEDRELGEMISSFLRSENPDARRVFVRKYWFFDSVEDIAKMHGFSVSKVKSMLFHTRNKLRKFLEKKGVYV